VQPGRYEIAAGFQYGAYLSSVLLDGEEMLGKELDLTEPRGPLVVVYKADGGFLRVDVQAGGRPDQSQPPALLMMPADPALRGPQFMYLLTLSKWKDIQLPGLRPGEYLVWAFDRFGRYEQLDDSDFLKRVESAARKVKIDPDGMHELQLPLTSWP
jgi:hypothetical protein